MLLFLVMCVDLPFCSGETLDSDNSSSDRGVSTMHLKNQSGFIFKFHEFVVYGDNPTLSYIDKIDLLSPTRASFQSE